MEEEMIKWFIDNLKPPYYKKMISAQVTHFGSLIPIRKRVDKGIRSKKNKWFWGSKYYDRTTGEKGN